MKKTTKASQCNITADLTTFERVTYHFGSANVHAITVLDSNRFLRGFFPDDRSWSTYIPAMNVDSALTTFSRIPSCGVTRSYGSHHTLCVDDYNNSTGIWLNSPPEMDVGGELDSCMFRLFFPRSFEILEYVLYENITGQLTPLGGGIIHSGADMVTILGEGHGGFVQETVGYRFYLHLRPLAERTTMLAHDRLFSYEFVGMFNREPGIPLDPPRPLELPRVDIPMNTALRHHIVDMESVLTTALPDYCLGAMCRHSTGQFNSFARVYTGYPELRFAANHLEASDDEDSDSPEIANINLAKQHALDKIKQYADGLYSEKSLNRSHASLSYFAWHSLFNCARKGWDGYVP